MVEMQKAGVPEENIFMDKQSGKNFDRPEYQKMKEVLKADDLLYILSIDRLGRNYEEIQKEWRILTKEIGADICVIDVAFKELLYDFYSEDLSEKVRTSLKARKAKGKFIACYAPYGYKKSKEDRNRLEIDEQATEIVRRIFREYLDGVSMFQIAKDLNKDGVPARSDYARSQGINFAIRQVNDRPVWNTAAVSSILHNRMYAGDLVYGKYKNEVIAGQCKKVGKEDIQIVENTHDAADGGRSFSGL